MTLMTWDAARNLVIARKPPVTQRSRNALVKSDIFEISTIPP
jgi:hypothetical protein